MTSGRRSVDPLVRFPFGSALLVATALAACGDGAGPAPQPSGSAQASASSASSVQPPVVAAPAQALSGPLTGGVVARLPLTETVVLADEDHRALRIVADAGKADGPDDFSSVELPGAPAQVVAWGDTVLVTIRDPGLLLKMRLAEGKLTEVGRVPLPADAWGLAVSKDEKRAVVTSAWTHKATVVDLSALRAVASVDVEREPRGVTLSSDGETAFITHLVGAKLTKLSSISSAPSAERIALGASPLRAPSGKSLDASLGYALALSADDSRLFVARHALGAMGREAWFGAATVDVLRPKAGDTLAPIHVGNGMIYKSSVAKEIETPDTKPGLPAEPLTPFTQPRDVRLRPKHSSLLVVGEGDNVLVELDALALDPTLSVLSTIPLGRDSDPHLGGARTCGAPSGVALSEDESTAYVFCRSTYDFARVTLSADPGAGSPSGEPVFVRLADDPLGEEIGKGRRLFYDATDKITSGGLACAGCHPEGRDDGYVWHEASFDTPDGGTRSNFVGSYENVPDLAKTKGFPRRTPMLAGRVGASGPYGWHAENATLADRIAAGMGLHRWGGLPHHAPENVNARAGYIAEFIRKGLVVPPREQRAPTPEEERGKVVFESKEAACSVCHRPDTDFTDRTAYPLKALPTRRDFDEETKQAFKTPSLLFVGGRAPYFHDGSASSLERLIEQNQDRMGKTSHLSPTDRAALVAYLKTL